MNRAASSSPPVLSRFNPAQTGTQGMKVIATGLLDAGGSRLCERAYGR
jgi:hypothetical protein